MCPESEPRVRRRTRQARLNYRRGGCIIWIAAFFPLSEAGRERTGKDGRDEWATAHFLFALKYALRESLRGMRHRQQEEPVWR